MRQSNQYDMKTTSGAISATLTANSAQAQFTQVAIPTRLGSGGADGKGLYNCQRNLVLQIAMTVVRSTGGTTPITEDMLAQAIGSINYYSPVLGTLIDPVTTSGIVAKTLSEYVMNGYKRSGANRLQIPGTDATYTRYLEISLPLRQMWNPWPDHFDLWTGWLDQAQLTVTAASNMTTGPFTDYGGTALSGCTVTSMTITPVIVAVPVPELVVPPIVQLRRYNVAAGSSGPNILGMGGDFGLQGMDDGSRLIGLWQAFNAFGYSGGGAAADVTAIQMKWREQYQSLNPWGFWARYYETITTYLNEVAGTTAVSMDEAHPFGTGVLSSQTIPLATAGLGANAYVLPLVWPEKQSLVSYYQKIKGNYSVDETFSTSQSGSFNMYAMELKQIGPAKCAELLALAGINPNAVTLVPKMGRKQNPAKVDPSKLWGLPRNIVANVARK
jgi:hypothetical protein